MPTPTRSTLLAPGDIAPTVVPSGLVRRRRIVVQGTVQGVGFRPFVHRLAVGKGLSGWVLNHTGGVEIEVEGPMEGLDAFYTSLRRDAPPLAQIDAVRVVDVAPEGVEGFEIRASRSEAGEVQPVPPDTAMCADCLRELMDPRDRRYRYPFINCTNCGPRFTIIESLPYDRPSTTMRRFAMCPACAREYEDPLDRRFHAQPVACAVCGPTLKLEVDGQIVEGDPIIQAADLLRRGQVVAIKGLGGFHLACDARDDAAVARLRERKHRGAKPFAVMFPDAAAIETEGPRALSRSGKGRDPIMLSDAEATLLRSPQRPIVLIHAAVERSGVASPENRSGKQGGERGAGVAALPVEKGADCIQEGVNRERPFGLAPSVAPGLDEIGVMLPSTPLHYLLLREFGGPLVMTSGNRSEEPIAADNDEARRRLGGIADAFLLHDRPIASAYDDSVTRVFEGRPIVLRRARSYAPRPIDLPFEVQRPILAFGAHLKSTFCLMNGRRAYVSQHIGDLENLETLEHFKATLALYERLFQIQPEVVVHDLHPEYLSTKLARAVQGVERIEVQHHHAHIASCLAEHDLDGPVIGVAFDGLGYGADGHLWGGEVLVADRVGFERRAHLREAPMPGGSAAVHKPYRMALGYLASWFPGTSGEDEADIPSRQPSPLGRGGRLLPRGAYAGFAAFTSQLDPTEVALIRQQVARGLNAPMTSSCGRLFDALAALLGVCPVAQYEGQAAMELQALADPRATGSYPFVIDRSERCWVLDPAPALRAALDDHARGVAVSVISMRFHRAVAEMVEEVCALLAEETGIHHVALSGGVFQNTLLLTEVVARLRADGLDGFFNERVPTNDGGISLGQAVIANARLEANRV